MKEHELQHSTSWLWVLYWEPKSCVPLNVGSMNLLGIKWHPCVYYWEDKPAHKAELFRTKGKNLHWSLGWTLEHCTKSQNILKGYYCFPATPETSPQTPGLCVFSVVYTKYSVEEKSWSFNTPDFIYWALSFHYKLGVALAIHLGGIWWQPFQLWG